MALQTVEAEFSMGADFATAPFQVTEFNTLTVELKWSGVDALDSTAIIQLSLNGNDWNNIKSDDNLLTLDTVADVQIWEILEITGRYYRLAYTANSVTSGSAEVLKFGGIK